MKGTIILTVSALITPLACNVRAEGGCPAGQIPYTGTPAPGSAASIASCGPIPTGGSTEEWASRWGAIALDAANRIMGAAANQKSKRLAVKEALTSCESRGGHACKLLSTYSNSCIVTIQGEKGANDTTAKSAEEATRLGMEACSRRGDSDCHVYYQACSLPVQVR